MAPPTKKKVARRGAKTGAAKNYITRTQAVRKLQISLQDFRRLCIFKGIYPREPKNKKKVKKGSTPATTFYYTKDIQYLLHEPLLAKFRDHKALAKKIGRALGRNEVGNAVRLDKNRSRMTLDHLVKERYPTFIDALRDLDDALSMLFLFASLPSHVHIPSKTIALCQRLTLEFQHYLIVSHSIQKSFLSIKGIYYQATIQGQDIMWLVPYKFVQKAAGDIDFRIMGTFIEFYTTLLGFVNYRLYTTIGLVYPPKFDTQSDEKGGELGAFTLEGKTIGAVSDALALENGTSTNEDTVMTSATAQDIADKVAQIEDNQEEPVEATDGVTEETGDTYALDTFEAATKQDADILAQPQFAITKAGSLFQDYIFFLSRETPKSALEFLLKAFGCTKIGWDTILGDGAFTHDEQDPRITHQIVDRPMIVALNSEDQDEDDEEDSLPKAPLRVPGRTYVQPQWVWDCINQAKLLRPDFYGPGATLPPHLSPWVKPKAGVYDPTVPLEQQEKEDEADLFEEEEAEAQAIAAAEGQEESESEAEGSSSEDEEEEEEDDDKEVGVGEGMQVDIGESDDEDVAAVIEESEEVVSEEELDSEDEANNQYQRELEAEAAGKSFSEDAAATKTSSIKKKRSAKVKAEQEELDRQRMMMTNRKRKLFDKMNYGNKKREAEAEKLRQKKRKLEKAKAGSKI